ncbi:MAG: DUF4097 domain-containing protein [candidate division KSB1 bacterium]|nr:DUF4097 domain-containing protein [candidate division KSB1 bacterium]MDZ7303788.1 DUF4097 domain-containing protein [candidate division KSB1 bacterium]
MNHTILSRQASEKIFATPPRMPSFRHAWSLTVVLLMLGVAGAFSQELRKEGRYYIADLKRNFSVPATGTLEMADIQGDVEIAAWSKNEVQIIERLRMDVYTEEEARRAVEATKASYSQSGDRIIVGGMERSRNWIQSDFQVSVPATFNLDISTSGGNISVRQIKGTSRLRTAGGDVTLVETGGNVRAITSGGNMTVRDAEGDIDVKTSGGNLELERIRGMLYGMTSGGNIILRGASKDARLRTSGGDVEIFDTDGSVYASTSGGNVRVENVRGRVEVSTSGGDIELRNIKQEVEASTSGGDVEAVGLMAATRLRTSGGDVQARDVQASIHASTSGGDVEVEFTQKDFTKPHVITLKSSGGSIELAIPEKLPATITAEIRLGNGRWFSRERYDISSDFPLKIQREEDRREGRYIRGEGQINGGGDLITLTTSAGNITIRKLAR